MLEFFFFQKDSEGAIFQLECCTAKITNLSS